MRLITIGCRLRHLLEVRHSPPHQPCASSGDADRTKIVHIRARWTGGEQISYRRKGPPCVIGPKQPAVILSDAIEGEAREVGRVHAALVR
ncbi:MAG: hypothetical protein AAFR93_08630, partial [Pseudomonadota bacterium]